MDFDKVKGKCPEGVPMYQLQSWLQSQALFSLLRQSLESATL